MTATRPYIYVLRPARRDLLITGPTPEEDATVEIHAAHLAKLAGEGVIVFYGRTDTADERTFGIVVFHAESEEAARALMAADPAVQGGVMTAELFPFRIVHGHNG
jgi:uncharacterized protein YciI